MLKLFDPDASKSAAEKKNVKVAVTSFFSDKPLVIDDKIPAGDINDYVTPTFYAPNASWLVQRNGMDKRHSLMIAQNASEGTTCMPMASAWNFMEKDIVWHRTAASA